MGRATKGYFFRIESNKFKLKALEAGGPKVWLPIWAFTVLNSSTDTMWRNCIGLSQGLGYMQSASYVRGQFETKFRKSQRKFVSSGPSFPP